MEALKKMGLDPARLERELISMLRMESPSLKIRDSLKKLLEGEKE